MQPEGFIDPFTSDETGLCLNILVSELIKRVTQVIEASDVVSTPPVAKIVDGAIVTK